MVGVSRSPQHYLGRDRGSYGRNHRGGRLWHQALEVGAHGIRWQDRNRVFEDRGSLHDAMPHTAGVSAVGAGPGASVQGLQGMMRFNSDIIDRTELFSVSPGG